MPAIRFKTVDEYISAQDAKVRTNLKLLRKAIRQAAPSAEEILSYNLPAYKWSGIILVWFAARKEHIGVYSRASVIEAFKNELSGYEISQGTIKFPLDKPIPVDLIRRIIKFKVSENAQKIELKKVRKKSSGRV
ncbi:MAG: DUF1801 domain-containing protein [Bacteroidetes bacterium]|nr:DUF1801 domain-containing protein [Bacteroidota bacterium]